MTTFLLNTEIRFGPTALNELAEQHPSLARARRVVRRLRRLR